MEDEDLYFFDISDGNESDILKDFDEKNYNVDVVEFDDENISREEIENFTKIKIYKILKKSNNTDRKLFF
jgi:hypothetical protein